MMLNILNIYDTRYGNTSELALIIEDVLSKEDGFVIKTSDVNYVSMGDISKADFLIIGSPTHFWKPTKEMQKLIIDISRERVRNKFACIYSTKLVNRLNSSAGRLLSIYLRKIGFHLITPWVDFFVEGYKGPLLDKEAERCRKFAEHIQNYLYRYYVT